MIDPAVAPDRRHYPERDTDHEGHRERGQRQLEGGRHPLQEVFEHRPPGGVALAEVPVGQPAHVAPVLDRHGLVQAHAPLHLRDVLRGREGARLHERRVARQDVGEHEGHQRHAEQRRQDEQDPRADVAEHARSYSGPP
jgi:hypothetical protein